MNDININKYTAFQLIATTWLNSEFPMILESDAKYKLVITFASYLDMVANQAEDKKKGKNVKKR